MNISALLIAGALTLGAAASAAAADRIYPGADAAEYKSPTGWTFTVSAYGWLAGLDGTVGAKGRTADVDASFGDILSNLDVAVMGLAEARYQRFGIFTDFNYVQLSASQNTPRGLLADSIDATVDNLMWTVAAEYRLLEQANASIDAFGGFRLFSVGNRLDFNAPGLLGGREFSQTETWADPVFGVKGRVSITPQLSLLGWGLLGGGASSKIVWDVMGGADYQFSQSFSAVVGYRAAGVNYENAGFVYDAVQQGPMLGAVFRF